MPRKREREKSDSKDGVFEVYRGRRSSVPRVLLSFNISVDAKNRSFGGPALILDGKGRVWGRALFAFNERDGQRFLAAFRDALNAIGPSEEAARAYG